MSEGTPAGDGSKILILATATCAYPAADATGQAHLHYPANTYILRVPSPVLFPDEFYYRCFEKGVGGILVMSCGHECPYMGAFEKLAGAHRPRQARAQGARDRRPTGCG